MEFVRPPCAPYLCHIFEFVIESTKNAHAMAAVRSGIQHYALSTGSYIGKAPLYHTTRLEPNNEYLCHRQSNVEQTQ